MKSTRTLFAILAGSLALLAGFVVMLVDAWPHVAVTLANATHAVAYACQAIWVDLTRVQLVLAGAFLLGFLALTGVIVRAVFRTVRLSRTLHLDAVPAPDGVEAVAAAAGIDPHRLTVVRSEKPFALTAGLRTPQVIVSTAAFRMLTRFELQAVLEHEAHHVHAREPFRRLLVSLALLWVPVRQIRQRLQQTYVTATELEADVQVHDQHMLGRALLRLVTPPAIGAGFSPLDARVERMVNPHFTLSHRWAAGFLLGAFVLVGTLLAVAPRAMAAAYANHPTAITEEHLNSCRIEHERMLQSKQSSCGPLSAARSCQQAE